MVGGIALVYLVISPSLGLLYALVQARQPFIAPARTLIRGRLDAHVHPEVWDRAFNRDVQPWVRIVFTNGTAVQGIARFAGLSPAGRQLFLDPALALGLALRVARRSWSIIQAAAFREISLEVFRLSG